MEKHDELKYQEAVKRVKKIKEFYTHALVYLMVNAMIIVANSQNSSHGFFHWTNFSTAFFWGIGLAAHGLSVFMPTLILGKDWEDKKIKELMEKEKNNKWE